MFTFCVCDVPECQRRIYSQCSVFTRSKPVKKNLWNPRLSYSENPFFDFFFTKKQKHLLRLRYLRKYAKGEVSPKTLAEVSPKTLAQLF